MHIALRLEQEERLLAERFGLAYQDYAQRTARFFPHLGLLNQ
jgi:protein-S-isoprenylcysteine O-methyltransferase Ste14